MGSLGLLGCLGLLGLAIAGCSGGDVSMDVNRVKLHNISEVSPESFSHLDQKKIFFGHQSVGNNIIQGMKDLARQEPRFSLTITRMREFGPLEAPGFYHAAIGKNDYPKTKVDAFAQAMDSGIGSTSDIAFMKFCFVDITNRTNVEEVFKYYTKVMEELRQRYPNVTLVHFTVPLLRRSRPSFKSWIKKLLGRADGFFADSNNIARNRYNHLLRKRYMGKEPVFDLSMYESTYPDGRRCTFSDGDKTYYSLVPEYTDDGGHLNGLGRKRVAEELLVFLSKLSK